jgi:hypothetical protein
MEIVSKSSPDVGPEIKVYEPRIFLQTQDSHNTGITVKIFEKVAKFKFLGTTVKN